jgi:YgiT-type zinc finger domain-containing protein
MKNDFCVKCGSEDLKTHEKELKFDLHNPGIVTIKQECKECQSCGETYFNSKQIHELSIKLKAAIQKHNKS